MQFIGLRQSENKDKPGVSNRSSIAVFVIKQLYEIFASIGSRSKKTKKIVGIKNS